MTDTTDLGVWIRKMGLSDTNDCFDGKVLTIHKSISPAALQDGPKEILKT